jgi:hypothetical protein
MSTFTEYLTFRRMTATVLVQVAFWSVVAWCGLSTILTAILAGYAVLESKDLRAIQFAGISAVFTLIVDVFLIVFARVFAEMIIVAFRINNTLSEMNARSAAFYKQAHRRKGRPVVRQQHQEPLPRIFPNGKA